MLDIDRARASTPENIGNFFDELEILYQEKKFIPALMFNMDESMIRYSPQELRIVVHSEYQYAVRVDPEEVRRNFHATLIACISATGCPPIIPTVILPRKYVPKQLEESLFVLDLAGTESGWINTEIFEEWLKVVFVPHVETVRKFYGPSEPALLLLDSHSSRKTFEGIKLLMDHNIVLRTLPSHTSHLVQPLDRGVFAKFKSELSKFLTNHKYGEDPIQNLMICVSSAIRIATAEAYAIDSFSNSGIHPINRVKVLQKTHELDIDHTPVAPKKARGRRGLKIDNRVLTCPDILEEIKAEAERQKSKKAKRLVLHQE